MQKTKNEIPKKLGLFSKNYRYGDQIGNCVDTMLEKIDTVKKLCPIAGTQTFCPDCSLSSPSN